MGSEITKRIYISKDNVPVWQATEQAAREAGMSMSAYVMSVLRRSTARAMKKVAQP